MTACPVNAIAVNPDTGANVVMEQTCVGCRLCTIACPFGTVFLNPTSQMATKCDLCEGNPACAVACPTDCITYEEVDRDTYGQWMGPLAGQVTRAHQEAFGNGAG